MDSSMYIVIIVRYPYYVLTTVLLICGVCLVLPFVLKKAPNFSDPQVGFETRGTVIAQRLTAWSNLLDATKLSGKFIVDPKEFSRYKTISQHNVSRITNVKKKKKKQTKKKKNETENKNASKVYIIATQRNFTKDAKMEKENRWKSLKELRKKIKMRDYEHDNLHLSNDSFFCGTPDQRYSRLVVSSIDGSNLFTYNSMIAMCHIQSQLTQNSHFPALCDTFKKHHCCRPWSLVNYITLLHNRTSCLALTEQDVSMTLLLLQTCSSFYHNHELIPDCTNNDCQTPAQCNQYNAVFNILHYLTDITFLLPNTNSSNNTHLQQSMIFLPIGCSTKTIDYYHDLEKISLSHNNVKVVAMEFGLKNAVFNEYLIKDSWLIITGMVCVLLYIWVYIESLFLTFMTIIAVIFSLGISYFMYTLVFNINFFPFMNLLATVVVMGIGADDVFIFYKIWYTKKLNSYNSETAIELMTKTFQHAILSMLVTSVTTAGAFYSSLISSVTTIGCFSVFAGTAIIANFFLMLTWLPASIIISEHNWTSYLSLPFKRYDNIFRTFRVCTNHLRIVMENVLLVITLKYRYFWLIFSALLTVTSLVIVLKYPGLQLPETFDFQLLETSHLFEQYDLYYKHKFRYERQKTDTMLSENFKLPLRFVWGILPEDNGNYMNPYSKGSLELDPTFDIADPLSQMWLLNFCRELKAQPFYLSVLGPLLPNCFIESFLSWMQRKCFDSFDNIDRAPCCEIHSFPYERKIFEMCIVEAISALYETPAEYYIPGVAGPKFSTDILVPTIQAVVVEYDSNYSYSFSYSYMEEFYIQVEKWTQEQLKHAPAGMQKGWFISELEFYDLQNVLSHSTIHAVCCTLGIACLVLLFVTRNILITLYAIFSITCSIFTTLAVLILLGWKLNVLESVAATTAIGLSVDYSLHYSISYQLYKDNVDRETCTRQAISSMGGSIAMAALTTGTAGAMMIPSSVLAYEQIGVFLVVVISISWIYSTFMFNALLSIFGPEREFGQFKCSFLRKLLIKSNKNKLNETYQDPTVSLSHEQSKYMINVLSKTSVTSVSPASALESHELELLTNKSNSYERQFEQKYLVCHE